VAPSAVRRHRGCGIDGGTARWVGCTPATTVWLTCPGRVRILETRALADARVAELWRTDTVRRRTMRMVVMFGLVSLLLIAMAVGGPGQVWSAPRAPIVILSGPPSPTGPTIVLGCRVSWRGRIGALVRGSLVSLCATGWHTSPTAPVCVFVERCRNPALTTPGG
jgi:hypothetical protein